MAKRTRTPSKSQSGLSVSAVVEQLRSDLFESALARDKDWKPLFRVEEATVELQFTVSEDAEVSGGLKFYVVSLGSKLKETSQALHKIAIKLSPLDANSPSGRISLDQERHSPLVRGHKKTPRTKKK